MAVARVGITPGSGSGSEINVKVVLSSSAQPGPRPGELGNTSDPELRSKHSL